jgi:hypothetical protein
VKIAKILGDDAVAIAGTPGGTLRVRLHDESDN